MTEKIGIVLIAGLLVFLCILVYQEKQVNIEKEKTKQIQLQLEIKKCR